APARKEDEASMCFLGLLVFEDPMKPQAAETVRQLASLGVRLKIITGDSRLAAAHLAEQIGLDESGVITGGELHAMRGEALRRRAEHVDVFAEIEPNQKERILNALRSAGHVVGFLGDGINDAPALHAADVGISVQGAVDVAREAADIVLLEPDLGVL